MINIKIDSRKVVNGDIFVALPGKTVDGHDYVNDAFKKGAIKAIVEHKVDSEIEQEVVDDTNSDQMRRKNIFNEKSICWRLLWLSDFWDTASSEAARANVCSFTLTRA